MKFEIATPLVKKDGSQKTSGVGQARISGQKYREGKDSKRLNRIGEKPPI